VPVADGLENGLDVGVLVSRDDRRGHLGLDEEFPKVAGHEIRLDVLAEPFRQLVVGIADADPPDCRMLPGEYASNTSNRSASDDSQSHRAVSHAHPPYKFCLIVFNATYMLPQRAGNERSEEPGWSRVAEATVLTGVVAVRANLKRIQGAPSAVAQLWSEAGGSGWATFLWEGNHGVSTEVN
jgi:hypothetical protein